MTLTQRFLRAWREAKTSATYDLFADTEDGWTNDDAHNALAFYNSATGLKLKARLSNYVIRCAVEATRQPNNTLYHNGLARGVALSVNAVEQHLIASSPRSESTSETQQPEVVADGLALI